jgi:WD40 repeat protein
MKRAFGLLSVVMCFAVRAAAAEPPNLDRYGDPLPRGAVARLGAERLRAEGFGVGEVAFLPGGKTLLAGCDGMLTRWDAATGKKLGPLMKTAGNWALSPDGKVLAMSGEKSVVLYATADGKKLRTWEEKLKPKQYVSSLAFSADGKTLAAADNMGTIRLYDAVGGKRLRELTAVEDKHCSWQIALSPDGKTLASSGGLDDHTLRVWDVGTGEQLTPVAEEYFECVWFLPDGGLLAGGWDHTVRV